VNGFGRTRLATGTAGRDSSPSWSPDGRRIAFATKQRGFWSVYVIGVDGVAPELVRDASAPAWSPDGSKIAYHACGGIKLATPAGADLTAPFGFRCSHFVVSGPPVWSPDGRKLAVARQNSGTYVMNADGSGLTRLTTAAGSMPGARFSQQRLSWRPLLSVLLRSRSQPPAERP
jgi:TolB protein